jgi:hypothetical protein
MTATPEVLGGVIFVSDHNPIPGMLKRPLAASEQVGRGQLVTVNPTTGYARLNDGTVPWQIAAGCGDDSFEMSNKDATAGNAEVRLTQRHFTGLAMKTSTDGFTDADWCTPWFIAGESTLGKLSHTGADATLSDRSIGGLVFGLDPTSGMPFAWGGPIAGILARSVMIQAATVFASTSILTTANTTYAEFTIPRAALVHGKITQVRICRAATNTDGDTNYWTVAVAKRTSTTPGTGVAIASKATKTTAGIGAMTAFVWYDLTLTTTDADLGILESDSITLTVTASSSAPAMQLTVEVIGKVA